MIKIENNWFVKLNFNKNKLKLILSIFALILVTFGLSFGLISFVSISNDQPNIISNDLAYRMVITENIESSNLFNDNIIKINKQNEKKEFLLNIYSLNDIDTKYGITYKVCGKFDINNNKCTEYVEKPKDLKIYYLEETDYPVEGNISSNGLALVSIIIDSSNSEYYTTIVGTDDKNIIEENLGIYVEFNLKACRLDSDLAYINPFDLSSGVLGGFENNDLSTIAYVDGVIISGMPTSGYYTSSVTCHKKGSTTSTTASGTAIWDCSKWILDVSNITESTACEVNFTPSSTMQAISPYPVFSYIVNGVDVGNAASGDKTKTTDESKVKLEISSDNKWKIYFYVSGTFSVARGNYTIDIHAVGGGGAGGAGGWNYFGGGGGGGYTNTEFNYSLQNSNYAISIGNGGTSSSKNGGSSSFGSILTAAGGYGGSDGGWSGESGGRGGSGGGNGGTNHPEQSVCDNGAGGGSNGNNGGTAQSWRSQGGSGQRSVAGPNGETGNTYDFQDTSLTLRAGGGGGGRGYNGAYSSGGAGGGGGSAEAGMDNYGGGGGGAQKNGGGGAKGGSGIVIIRGESGISSSCN